MGGLAGDVLLAIAPHDPPVGVDHRRAVVIQPRRPPLEHRRDHHDPGSLRRLRQGLGARPGHRLREVEQRGVLALREVQRAKQLRETDEPGPGRRRLFDLRDALLEVRVRIGRHRHLDEPDLVFGRRLRAVHGGEHYCVRAGRAPGARVHPPTHGTPLHAGRSDIDSLLHARTPGRTRGWPHRSRNARPAAGRPPCPTVGAMVEREPLVRQARLWFGLLASVDRRTYLTNGLALMGFKYAVDAGAVGLATGRFWSPLDYLLPFYLLRAEKLAGAPAWFLPAFVVWTLPFLWIGVAMTLRRAVDAGRSPWLALAFFVPLFNYLVMLALCGLPTVPLSRWEEQAGGRTVDARLPVALYGVAAGLAVAIPTILLNVYVLRRYSTSLFLGTPFTLGAVTAYVFNRAAPQGAGATAQVVSLSLVLLAGAMLLFALEGLVCVVLALPLALALAILGGIFGRAIALHTPGRAGHLASLVLAAPLLAGLDEARGPSPTPPYQVEDSVVVAAPRAVGWRP